MVDTGLRRQAQQVTVWFLAALSLAAGATHFSVVGEHYHEHIVYGLFFMALAWFQVLWAAGMLLRRSRRILLAGAVVNALVIVLYVVSRTSGLPLGPEAWEPEGAAALDIVCTVFEALIVVLAAALWQRHEESEPSRILPSSRAGIAAAAALVLLVAGVGSASLASAGGGEEMAMGGDPAVAAPSGQAEMADMPGMPGMSAADTDPLWHYTGPALPAGTTRLLQTVYQRTEEGHAMQDPSCTQAPTAQQQAAALALVQRSTAGVAKYHDLQAAVADGYVPITNPAYPMVHYIKGSYLQSQYVLDPNHVQSLVYDRLPSGQYVLVAAMYLMPRAGDAGPTPGGCLTQWHAHTNLCMSLTLHRYEGFAPCPDGTVESPTPEMLHVWQVPVPGGPLAMDPTDLQVMQAAIMATDGSVPG